MKHNFYKMQDKMNEETISNKDKKVWAAPELEILNGRKTYNGEGGTESEDYWWVEDPKDRLS